MDVDEYLGAHTVEQLGPDNLVLSTDYPHHDSAYPHALDEFLVDGRVQQGDEGKDIVGQLCQAL